MYSHCHCTPLYSHIAVCLDSCCCELLLYADFIYFCLIGPPFHHVHIQYVYIISSSQAVSLWTSFMGFTDGKEPLVIYIIVCWGKSASCTYVNVLIIHHLCL